MGNMPQSYSKHIQMSQLTIMARILAKPEKKDLVKAEVLKLVDPTRNEEGNMGYDLFQDNENENLFLFHETWASEELLIQHTKSSHFIAFGQATEGAIAEFTIQRMTQIR